MLGSAMPLPTASPPPTCPSCRSSANYVELARRRDLQLRRCSSCGLVYQANPPSAAEIVSIYSDDYYNYWGLDQNFDDLWEMKTKTCLAYLDLLGHYLPQGLSAPQILDIGCAHGFMLEGARQKGFQAFGIEISPAASVARERGFTVYEVPLHELALPAETFDAITIIDVLEHIPDLQGFMKEVNRILKPQGTMLIVTPDVGSWIAKIMKAKWPHYKREHIFYFSQSSLSSLLRRTGFSVEFRPGFKYLSYEYVLQHFQKYTGGWLTAVLASIYPALPLAVARRPVRFPTEMLAIAQRGTT